MLDIKKKLKIPNGDKTNQKYQVNCVWYQGKSSFRIWMKQKVSRQTRNDAIDKMV